MKTALCVPLLACALISWIIQDLAAQQPDPTRGSKNVDQVVPFPMEAVMKAAKKAVLVYGCSNIKKEATGYLECTRPREVGVFVGSGGEKVKVWLSKKANGTQIRINTGKGMMGRLGKKNWSTPIFNEMMEMLGETAEKRVKKPR